MLELAVSDTGHTDAVVRNASHKVAGAVEWVDNPDKLGVLRQYDHFLSQIKAWSG